jgi:flagellar biosynthesis regulator FlbT
LVVFIDLSSYIFLQWLVPVMMELLDDTMKENATEFHKTAWKKLLGVVAYADDRCLHPYQELLTLPENTSSTQVFSKVHVAQSLVFLYFCSG